MDLSRYLPRALPDALRALADLALDLRWAWSGSADALWQRMDADLWAATGDPWLILETISEQRLDELKRDSGFLDLYRYTLNARNEYLEQPAWFGRTYGADALGDVAYFSMEFGLSEALPIYSGGLGILAGDHMKTASDLGVPVIGIGLLYQQGYFRQALDAQGEQLEFFPYNNPTMLPVTPLRDEGGGWLRIGIELPGRTLYLRGWQVSVGRTNVYLLDSNDLLNTPSDRGITGELYGGGSELRLQQELVLGIGGWRLLSAQGIAPEVCHLNEGHAAFAILERAAEFAKEHDCSFGIALRATRSSNLFTTHTPVEAGFDRFSPELFARYLQSFAERTGITMAELLSLGRADPKSENEPFNMAYLALRGSGQVNGVSRLHGAVSRKIFQPLFPRWPADEVPIAHVTNGIHVPSWDSAAADALWTEACGASRWLGDLKCMEHDLRRVSDEALWELRAQGRLALVRSVRARLSRQRAARGESASRVADAARVLDPDVLTLGFARRFAGYKRPALLITDPDRLTVLLSNPERPLQLVIAGKAHPHDGEGKRMIRKWSEYLTRTEVQSRVVFLEDYDIALAADMVQGVDVWLNTPRRPWEASGTSGMKVLVNGGLNLSELDGWWAEAYSPDVGWKLGDGREHAGSEWDVREAAELYSLLENEVIPAFYERDTSGKPLGWIGKIRESMARLAPQFSANRMLREYTERYYIPGAHAYRERRANGVELAAELEAWHVALGTHFPELRFGRLDIEREDDRYHFQVHVYFGELTPDAVEVELYADRHGQSGTVRVPMVRAASLAGTINAYAYEARVPCDRPASDYTPRIVPYHPRAVVPLECEPILWQK